MDGCRNGRQATPAAETMRRCERSRSPRRAASECFQVKHMLQERDNPLQDHLR
jgi:hypothetical protein